jgi:NTE family protein
MTSLLPFENQDIWHHLGENERIEIKNAMRVRRVARGQVLIEQDSPSETLYIVNFGLFDVRSTDGTKTVAEIGAGQLIGEMGFFARLQRTASVVAARDSEVLEIDRSAFDELVARCPQIQPAISRSLANRLVELAKTVGAGDAMAQKRIPRVITVIAAGAGRVPSFFAERLRRAAVFHNNSSCFLTSAEVKAHFGAERIDPYVIGNWLADVERKHHHVICIADNTLSDWTQTSLGAADQLIIVAEDLPGDLNRVEAFAYEMLPPARRHLIRLHAHRTGVVQATTAWLRHRNVFMIHHLSTEDGEDFDRLGRFMTGRAIGFVGGAGGASGAAHVGVLKAFREAGIDFDISGGSSIGAIASVASAMLWKPEEIDDRIAEIFVRRRAMEKRTLPRYGMIDHTVFDSALQEQFGWTAMEDVWKPCFAVATDLSSNDMRIIRTGPLWQAIRASCALPGSLPPFFDKQGHMLVDGGVVDNVPIDAMRSLKAGPNVVVDLRPLKQRIYDLSYQSIPGRWQLLAKLINPFAREKLPACPGPGSVTLISMFANLRGRPIVGNSGDLILRPPPVPGSRFMNFGNHRDVSAAAYKWTLETIDSLKAQNNPAFAAMERAAA